MCPLICSWGFESKLEVLKSLYHARLKLALLALFIQMLAVYTTLRPFIFTSCFNIPSILALLLCLSKGNLAHYSSQKWIKFLLKIGLAKVIGGFCLAIFMGLKYAYLPPGLASHYRIGSTQESYLKLCAIYFTASALIDLVYSIIAREILFKTKQIVGMLKEKKKQQSPRSSRSNSPKIPKLPEVGNQQVQEP